MEATPATCLSYRYTFAGNTTLSNPPRSQTPSPQRGTKNFDKSGIGHNLHDSIGVLGLKTGATVREVKIRYQTLARRLHPNKNYPNVTGLYSEEAVELFKLVNNAQQFLCTTLCNYY